VEKWRDCEVWAGKILDVPFSLGLDVPFSLGYHNAKFDSKSPASIVWTSNGLRYTSRTLSKCGFSKMIEYIDRRFDSLFDRGSTGVISEVRCVNCEFSHSGLSLTSKLEQRTVVRSVDLFKCRINGCEIGPAVLEDVTISDLQTNDLLILWGTLFRRVRLSGKIGRIKINKNIDAIDRSPKTQGPFDEFRKKFYSETDWALDIRDAKFKEFELRGIPSSLIRRDPESQVVITRERALESTWREQLSSTNKFWPFVVDMFLSDGDSDRVLIAPLDAPKKKRDLLLTQLNELRIVGVALPD
jgi:hypothetical protein